MLSITAIIVLATAALVQCQRPSFAGTKPIGYPEYATTEGLVDRFGEVDGTTQRLPVEANGDRDLIDRLSKLPVDKQPFWFINWQALEAHRQNPQTYPQKPNTFIDPQNFNSGNSASSNPGNTANSYLGNTASFNPGNTQSFNPGNTASFNPGNTATFNPGNTPSFNPGNTPNFNPGNTASFNPGNTASFNPGNTVNSNLGNTASFNPGNTANSNLGNTASFNPGNLNSGSSFAVPVPNTNVNVANRNSSGFGSNSNPTNVPANSGSGTNAGSVALVDRFGGIELNQYDHTNFASGSSSTEPVKTGNNQKYLVLKYWR